MYLFLCQHHAVLITVALWLLSKSDHVAVPALFLLKMCLAIQGLLCLHAKYKIICSNVVEVAIGVLMWAALNL